MGIGVSILLVAAGAVMTWAVHVDTSGFSVNTIGIILLIVGAIGLIWSLAASSAMPWRRGDVVHERHIHRA
jgi:hypothetical protein